MIVSRHFGARGNSSRLTVTATLPVALVSSRTLTVPFPPAAVRPLLRLLSLHHVTVPLAGTLAEDESRIHSKSARPRTSSGRGTRLGPGARCLQEDRRALRPCLDHMRISSGTNTPRLRQLDGCHSGRSQQARGP